MLFLGTKSYPKEDSFSSFLSSNGGFSNAFTDSENTVYYFDMDAEADNKLKEGLDRFGSFFTEPLFTESATGRELNAIESENSKNLQSDVFRIFQIQKSRANLDHPFSKFFTGNKKTLFDDTKKQNIDLREELIEFYTKYYSANQMTFALIAPQSIDAMKKYVAESFGDIPNRNTEDPESAWKGVLPFQSGSSIIPSYGTVVEVVPVQDLRQVTLTFPIIYADEVEKSDMLEQKPDFYVSHLIGHEGPGSVLSYLKQKGWANSLGASVNEELSDFATFDVTVELTSKGLKNIDDVVEAVFSYIRMLRKERIPEYIFDEVLNLSELEWRFLTKGQKSNYAMSLAQSMRKYTPELVVSGPRRLAVGDIKSGEPRSSFSSSNQRVLTMASTQKLLSKMTVDNMFMTILSKTFEGKTSKTEKWYGTGYNVREIPLLSLSKWSNCYKASEVGMAFPGKNMFIPSERGLKVKKPVQKRDEAKKRSFEERMKPVPSPVLVRDDGADGRWTVHFKQDDRFGEPKAFLIFELLTDKIYSSARSAVLAQLYQICAKDSLNEYTYDATLAGLSYDVQVLPRGVRLTFGGYNDKLADFASYVANKLSKEIDSVLPPTEEEFERNKDNISRGLAAFDVKQPYSHAIYYSSLAIQPEKFQYSNADMREALKTISLSDLKAYARTIWASGKGEALVQGNVDKKEALALVDVIDQALAFQTITADEYPGRLKALPLPISRKGGVATKLTISEPNPSNQNSVSQFYIQNLGVSETDHVLIEVLSALIEQPFYDDLRTQQQLGYIVSSGVKGLEETRVFSLIVQSSVATAEALTDAIYKFLEKFRATTLANLTDVEFSLVVKGILDRKTEPDKKLAQEVIRNWNEIVNGKLQFNRVQTEASALLSLQKEDVLLFWDDIFSSSSKNGRRLLICEVVPRTGSASSKAPATSSGYGGAPMNENNGVILGIDDLDKFRKDREAISKA